MLQNKKHLRMEQSSMHAYHQVFYLCLKIMQKTEEPETLQVLTYLTVCSIKERLLTFRIPVKTT